MENYAEKLLQECEAESRDLFAEIDKIALKNTEKVLKAFSNNSVAERHMKGTTGYGYDDIGRDCLNNVYADVLGAEKAIVSPYFASGTHALTVALFGLLRPNDTLLSISGEPYDTLLQVIKGKNNGSLADFGVKYKQVDMLDGGIFDFEAITEALKVQPKVVFVTRSRGYSMRNALSIEKMSEVVSFIRKISDAIIMMDNCYGEFVDTVEPLACGADIIVGSLTKNIGGGLASTGGYVAGKMDLVEQISYRLTAPSVGVEIGSYSAGYQYFYQGLFLAPHFVANALKGSILFGKVFEKLGYRTVPQANERCYDIIRSIIFDDKEKLIEFCHIIQSVSPIDSYVKPEPWAMPGYEEDVIMAAGTFVGGASLELTADAPIKPPYVAYVQGGLTLEHIKCALIKCIGVFAKY